MPVAGSLLVSDRTDRNDRVPLPVLEVASEGVTVSQGCEVGSRRHDDLKATAVADVKADVKQAVHQFKSWRLGNIENGVKVTGGQNDISRHGATPERDNLSLTKVNETLQPKVCIPLIRLEP